MSTQWDRVADRITDALFPNGFCYKADSPEYQPQADLMTKLFKCSIRQQIMDILLDELDK